MSSIERLAPTLPPAVEPPESALRGRRYGEDRFDLLARDPRSVLALWEVTPALHARAEAAARAAGSPIRYQIRIDRRDSPRAGEAPLTAVDLPDAVGGESWCIPLPRSGGECRAVLGLSLRDRFEELLRSAWVAVPPEGPCAEEGTWDTTPEGRAWLLARVAAGVPGSPTSSIARYLPPRPGGRTR